MDKLDALLKHPDMDPNKSLPGCLTPLSMMVQRRCIPELKRILQHPHTDPNRPDGDGDMLPLQWAYLSFFGRTARCPTRETQNTAAIVALLEGGARLYITRPVASLEKYRHTDCGRDITLFLNQMMERFASRLKLFGQSEKQEKLAIIKNAIETGLELYDQKQEQKWKEEQQQQSNPEV